MARKYLTGRTVLVTRPKDQAQALTRALNQAGARVVAAPAIRIATPSSYAGLDAALRRLGVFDCAVFTSQNAVERFFERARSLRVKTVRPRMVFAIGTETAGALKAHGWRPKAAANVRRGEDLARAMGRVRGLRILIPRAKVAREELPSLLRRKGARVTVVEAYRTLPDRAGLKRLRQAAKNGASAVTFTSASTVEQFMKAVGQADSRKLFRTCAAASIGPVTSAALRSYGIKPAVEARETTSASLARSLMNYFAKRKRA